jgi:hypothetical protein
MNKHRERRRKTESGDLDIAATPPLARREKSFTDSRIPKTSYF